MRFLLTSSAALLFASITAILAANPRFARTGSRTIDANSSLDIKRDTSSGRFRRSLPPLPPTRRSPSVRLYFYI
ncbi:hypothetical protein B0H11DRAFT_1955065, partial [Mycena galericulata]